MNRTELARIANAMVAKNKGILAADESTGTIGKRFAAINLDSTEERMATAGRSSADQETQAA